MSHSNAALRIPVSARDPESNGAEARPGAMIPAAERAGPAVAGRSARPAAGGEPRHAPGTPMARIYQRGRSPMQSGRACESAWRGWAQELRRQLPSRSPSALDALRVRDSHSCLAPASAGASATKEDCNGYRLDDRA